MIFIIIFGKLIQLNPFRKEPTSGSIDVWYFLDGIIGVARHRQKEV